MRQIVAIVIILFLTTPALTRAADVSGQAVTAEPAGSRSWDQMLARDARRADQDAEQPAETVIPAPHMTLPVGGELLVGPPAPAPDPIAAQRAGADRGACPGLSAPSISESFLAIEDQGNTIPPDTMGAVGPNHVITMLNDLVRIQDRTGGTISTVSLTSFWSGAAPIAPFDPTVLFDELAGRYIACCDSGRRSASSAALFAISRTNDPTGTWDFYSLDADPSNFAWADFPRMGYNSTWIAITDNMFAVSNDAFQGVTMWAIDVASALVPGGPLAFTRFDYGFDFSGGVNGAPIVPANTHDVGEATLWLIDATGFTSGGTQLHRVSRITGTGPAPVWSVAPGSPFTDTGFFFVNTNYSGFTPDAEQLGTATLISSNDSRALDAEFRNGALWYTHAGGLPAAGATRTSSFWYQIDPNALPNPIIQSGAVDAPGVYHIFPSIAVNCADDMMLGLSRSSSSIYIEAAFAHRLAGDALGTTRAVQTIKSGEDSYVKDFGSGSVRWGDYSATGVDPNDDTCMWTIQEYARLDVGPNPNNDRWGTWWGSLCESLGCVGDIDGDGDTDVFDFAILAPNFGMSGFPPFTNGDLDGDGDVDVFDFGIFAPDFGCVP